MTKQTDGGAADALAALMAPLRKLGIRSLVAGWNGEGKPDGPYEPHPDTLGVTLKTNCGTVYALDEAMQAADALLTARNDGGEG